MNANRIPIITLLTLLLGGWTMLQGQRQIDPKKSNPQQTRNLEKFHRVKLNLQNHEMLHQLQEAGIGLECGAHHDHSSSSKSGAQTIITELSESELTRVREKGISFEYEIQDVSRFYEERALRDLPKAKNELRQLKQTSITRSNVGSLSGCIDFNPAVPSNFDLGSMGGFITYQEMLDHLDAMAAQYPNLITVRAPVSATLNTIQGRDMYYVKISDNPNVDENESEVLYTGLHHAREPVSMMNLIYYMWYLLENYNSDPDIQSLVNNREMFFIPCVNPDGYLYNQSTNPNGGGMWRKNLRNNGNGTFGVDINRNYGYNWGYDNSGSSGNTNSNTYRGTSPFSEPETQMVRDFCNAHNFRVAMNDHSYSNLLLYPWGYSSSAFNPDEDIFYQYGRNMTTDNRYKFGQSNVTIYPTNGDSNDWMYGEQSSKPKIFAFIPESGSSAEGGFWPSPSNIVPIIQREIQMLFMAAYYAGGYAEIKDLSPAYTSGLNGQLDFSVKRMGQEGNSFTVNITPLSANIQSVSTNTVNFSGMNVLQVQTGSVSYTLNNGVGIGEKIEFEISMSSGGHELYKETHTKIYDPTVLLADNPDVDGLSNWSTSTWGLTSEETFTGSQSITDSPNSNYPNNSTRTITLSSPVDLSNANEAYVSFYSRWEIEDLYDYVQFEVSTNGSSWTELCGQYTKRGTAETGAQPVGEALYDGTQEDWVKEEFDLTPYIGQSSVYFRFRLRSDGGVTDKGFFFDDFTIVAIPNALNQTITFDPIADKLPGDAPFAVNATASSGLPVSVSIVSGPATISGNTITLNGTEGTVVVRASQAGNGTYNAAPDVDQSFDVSKLNQTITFESIPDKLASDVPFAINATASSGLPVSFSIVSGPASISGNTITLDGNVGTVVVRASQGGNTNYNAAADVDQSFDVNKLDQTISFDPIADKLPLDAPFGINASASSSLPVSFNIVSGPATISGSTITLDGTEGTVVVRASQAGDATYNAAPGVDQSFDVSKLDQTISFDPIADKLTSDGPFTLMATASSGLPVSFNMVSGPATVAGNTVTLTGAVGTVVVRASQLGNGNFNAATNVDRGFNVTIDCSATNISVNASGTDATCNGGSDGTATAGASGGTAPYSYSWSNGATGANVSGLLAGSYTVTATDANGCTGMATVTIGEPAGISLTMNPKDVSCSGGSDGSASVVISGGTAPYTYSWSNGSTNPAAFGLTAGSYSVTVTDANGCSASASTTINDANPIVATPSITDVSCFGGNDGAATLAVSGGTAPYVITWSSGDFGTSATGLAAGTYIVDISDASDCAVSINVTISEPAALSASISNSDISCNGGSDGAASVSVSGGTAPYSYAWSNGSTTSSISGLAEGSYSVDITDANGCTTNASISLRAPMALTLGASGSDASCNGANDGAATANASGGTAPYSYSWSNGASGASVSLGAGTYTVTVTDANGCTASTSVSIGAPTALVASASATAVDCNDGSNGTASASVSGGTAPYTYSWSNGGTGTSISGLAAGTYTVTVTDANGCTAAGTAVVIEPALLTLSITGSDATSGNNGAADLTVSGGTPAYSYSWSNGATTEDISGLAAGTYSVTVTDANGCTATESVTINEITACPGAISTFPYTESFEGGLGAWSQVSGDDLNWTRDASGTPSRNTGPSSAFDGNFYMYVESSSPNYPSKVAILEGPCFDLTGESQASFMFNYHMYGSSMGTLTLEASDDGGSTWAGLWSRSGNQNNTWYDAVIDLSPYTGGFVQLRFVGTTGSSWQSDMTIDNLMLTNGAAPLVYCGSNGNNTNYEWIQRVIIGAINNNSGNDGGYEDFTNLSTSANPGTSVSVSLQPGFSSTVYVEDWRIWVDYNQDGDFDDAGELVFAPASSNGTVSGSFTIPGSAALGQTRMRVSMKWNGAAGPCESFTYGEVEDYTLDIGGSAAVARGNRPNSQVGKPLVFTQQQRRETYTLEVYPNPAQETLNIELQQNVLAKGALKIFDTNGRGVWQENRDLKAGLNRLRIDVTALPSGYYTLQIESEGTVHRGAFVKIP